MARRFVTTEAHFKAFSWAQRRRFEEEMLVHLRREYKDVLAGRDDDEVRELIREGIEQADGHNIVLERDVARYLELMLARSPAFDDSSETPWARDALGDPSLAPDEKLDSIYEHILFAGDRRPAGELSVQEVPPPFHRAAVLAADAAFQSSHPGRTRRKLTLDWQDDDDRAAWMAAYHQALEALKIPPASARPGAPVGAAIAEPQEPPMGSLTVELVDGETNESIAEGSVQVSGPAVHRVVCDGDGAARFGRVAIGEYQILAVPAGDRMGQGRVTVRRGRTRVRITCVPVSRLAARR